MTAAGWISAFPAREAGPVSGPAKRVLKRCHAPGCSRSLCQAAKAIAAGTEAPCRSIVHRERAAAATGAALNWFISQKALLGSSTNSEEAAAMASADDPLARAGGRALQGGKHGSSRQACTARIPHGNIRLPHSSWFGCVSGAMCPFPRQEACPASRAASAARGRHWQSRHAAWPDRTSSCTVAICCTERGMLARRGGLVLTTCAPGADRRSWRSRFAASPSIARPLVTTVGRLDQKRRGAKMPTLSSKADSKARRHA